jgi:hypothetical protein
MSGTVSGIFNGPFSFLTKFDKFISAPGQLMMRPLDQNLVGENTGSLCNKKDNLMQ